MISTDIKASFGNQRRAAVRGRNQAADDFNNSTIQQSEWEQAQAEVAQQMIQTYGAQTGLNESMMPALQNSLEVQANQQQTLMQFQNAIGRLLQFQSGLRLRQRTSPRVGETSGAR